MWKLIVLLAYIAHCQGKVLAGTYHASIESRFNQLENEMEKRIKNLESELEKVKTGAKGQANRVGFSVYLAGTNNVGGDERVMYNTVVTNEGSGWNMETGGFICPATGLYYFSVTSFSYDGHLAMQMVKDSVPIATAHSDGGNWDQGSNSVIVNCIIGEEVYVKQTNPNGGQMESDVFDAGNILNSFLGFLISL